jgi:hypothetical protein
LLSTFFCPSQQKKVAKKNALDYEKISKNYTSLAARSKLSRKRKQFGSLLLLQTGERAGARFRLFFLDFF